MNLSTKDQAFDFLCKHFDGIGEEHPDYQEGIKAVNYLESYIIDANKIKDEWIGSLAEL